MSKETNQESSFERLLEKTLQHLETRWEFFSLTATEKLSGAAFMFSKLLIISVFALIILFFISIGFAIWLGDYIGSRAGGFALAGLIFVPFAVAAYIWVPPFVRTKTIQNILQDDDTENNS